MLRILLPGGALLGLVLLVRRTMSLRDELESPTLSPDPWTPIPARPEAPAESQAELRAEAPSVAPGEAPAWVPVNQDGACPPTHPIKAKATSGLYHLPGMAFYGRTKPDRCYAEEAAAVADGFTKSKR